MVACGGLRSFTGSLRLLVVVCGHLLMVCGYLWWFVAVACFSNYGHLKHIE